MASSRKRTRAQLASASEDSLISIRVAEGGGGATLAGRQQPASFVSGGGNRVFRPLKLSAAQKQPICFKAKLTEDFMGAGTKGQTVDVELDLFGQLCGQVKAGDFPHDVLLLEGSRVTDTDFGKLLAAHEAQEAAAAAVE